MGDEPPIRVVSLLPSATEILFQLGVEPVGVSHSCDWPPAVQEIPAVTSTVVDQSGSSSDINEQVVENAEDDAVFSIDSGMVRELEPDTVLTQGVCDVCAIDEDPVRDELQDIETEIVSLDAHTIDDVVRNIMTVGELIGREGEAGLLADRFSGRIAGCGVDAGSPGVVVLDWMDPVMTAGHWVPELVEAAGGRSPLSDAGDRSRRLDWDEVRRCDPDCLVLSPCGLSIEETRERIDAVADRSGWGELSAVQDGSVYIVDGSALMNRPGPRLAETAEVLADALAGKPSGDWRCQRL